MSFTLNQVTRRAGGGDITRTREFAGAEISVGRGSDCDIQLQDLAVSLRHVQLRQTGPSAVKIDATGREPFEIDGRFASTAEITTDAEHKLVLGSHTLLLAQGANANDIAITVTRSETAPTAADEDEEKIFSISDSMLGKRPWRGPSACWCWSCVSPGRSRAILAIATPASTPTSNGPAGRCRRRTPFSGKTARPATSRPSSPCAMTPAWPVTASAATRRNGIRSPP